jgi:serine/threonine protein kinase
MLKNNQKLMGETTAKAYTILEFLGGGGQGEVYKASLNNQEFALKYYHYSQATSEQLSTIENLIRIGQPSSNFLWPIEIVQDHHSKSFGYVMPLRPSNFKNLVDLMKRRISPSFKAIATACIELPHHFYQLHAKGLCYRDISFGNVFFDPDSGNTLICDNDNVTIDGQSAGGVLGTPRFMAPEIVRGEALPSTQTDLFSLAILLFYLLMVHHPLEGEKEANIRCFDLPAMNKIYGEEPVFIFDPDNPTNRPVGQHQQNANIYWSIYPDFVKDLFIKAFTDGIKDPVHGRVRETEWRACMAKLRDSILYCHHCGNENFFDVSKIGTDGKLNCCWNCKKNIQVPPQIRIEKKLVMLNHDTVLCPHHVNKQKRYDFSGPFAVVNQHPTDKNIWGLKNLSDTKWVVTDSDGGVAEVLPGQSTRISRGKSIHFGNLTGFID